MSYVLVVDPNPLTHRRVTEALGDAGVQIQFARDAVEAEQKSKGKAVDLLLSSAVLPRGNGYDLSRGVIARCPGAVCYLLTGGFEVYNSTRAAEAGVAGQIPKPFSPELLRDQVSGALNISRGVEAATAELDDLPVEIKLDPVDDSTAYAPPTSAERVATFLPRDYGEIPVVAVDPAVVGPALEAAILEVLPEVVDVVLRRMLQASSSFRDLVEVAVDEAVRAQVPAITARLVAERLAEIEARGPSDADPL